MPVGMAINFLKSATHGNPDLLGAWATCKTIRENLTTGSVPTYDQYFEYIMNHAKKLEDSITVDTTSGKANVAESSYLQTCSPSDEYYNDAAELSSLMIGQGGDVDTIHDVLQCKKAMKQGLTRSPPRT